jgi:hypothetical protein
MQQAGDRCVERRPVRWLGAAVMMPDRGGAAMNGGGVEMQHGAAAAFFPCSNFQLFFLFFCDFISTLLVSFLGRILLVKQLGCRF